MSLRCDWPLPQQLDLVCTLSTLPLRQSKQMSGICLPVTVERRAVWPFHPGFSLPATAALSRPPPDLWSWNKVSNIRAICRPSGKWICRVHALNLWVGVGCTGPLGLRVANWQSWRDMLRERVARVRYSIAVLKLFSSLKAIVDRAVLVKGSMKVDVAFEHLSASR